MSHFSVVLNFIYYVPDCIQTCFCSLFYLTRRVFLFFDDPVFWRACDHFKLISHFSLVLNFIYYVPDFIQTCFLLLLFDSGNFPIFWRSWLSIKCWVNFLLLAGSNKEVLLVYACKVNHKSDVEHKVRPGCNLSITRKHGFASACNYTAPARYIS